LKEKKEKKRYKNKLLIFKQKEIKKMPGKQGGTAKPLKKPKAKENFEDEVFFINK